MSSTATSMLPHTPIVAAWPDELVVLASLGRTGGPFANVADLGGGSKLAGRIPL